MEKIGTFAAVFAGLFVVAFVIAFLWGVARQALRWAVIAAAAYAAVVMTVRAAHLGHDGAAITIADLLAATSGPHCAVAGSTAARSGSCTGSTR